MDTPDRMERSTLIASLRWHYPNQVPGMISAWINEEVRIEEGRSVMS
jgi:hypothetical protein